jgi:predicted nucleic acid-binding protein
VNKVVVDTSLYIEWFRGNLLEHSIELLNSVPYLSSVVATELFAGAHTKIQKRELSKFLSCYEKAERIITPSYSSCIQAGKCIEKLKYTSKSILGDSLIAMSAKSIGAEVWTANHKDFVALKSATPFKLKTVSSA